MRNRALSTLQIKLCIGFEPLSKSQRQISIFGASDSLSNGRCVANAGHWGNEMAKGNSELAPSRFSARSKAESDSRRRRRTSIWLSSIKRMHKSGIISDAELVAAERFHVVWASANSDCLNAIYYRRPRVDGLGPNAVGVTERRLWARQDLDRIRRKLGERDFKILVIVAGQEQSLGEVRVALRCRKADASYVVKCALENLSMIGAARGAGYGIRAGS